MVFLLAKENAEAMSNLNLLRRLPSSFVSWLFFCVVPLTLIFRFLIGNVFGLLITSVLLYFGTSIFGESKPFNFAQLILWIDGLPIDSKTSAVASVLTIVGFLIAFQTATASWKAEALANLKSHVAAEIEQFFSEASRLTSDAEIYVDL
jgi:hypothetical protein